MAMRTYQDKPNSKGKTYIRTQVFSHQLFNERELIVFKFESQKLSLKSSSEITSSHAFPLCTTLQNPPSPPTKLLRLSNSHHNRSKHRTRPRNSTTHHLSRRHKSNSRSTNPLQRPLSKIRHRKNNRSNRRYPSMGTRSLSLLQRQSLRNSCSEPPTTRYRNHECRSCERTMDY